jgi:hypothetical protein
MAFGDMGERTMTGCFWSGLGLILSERVYNTKAMLLSSISPARSVRRSWEFSVRRPKVFLFVMRWNSAS